MKTLLRLMAAVCMGWAMLLLGFKDRVLAPQDLTALVRALANGLGIANVVLAYLFWDAAREPTAHRGTIYAAIALAALKTANDLYELLVLLPADKALVALVDLVFSVGLVVGLLEALPRLIAGAASKPSE